MEKENIVLKYERGQDIYTRSIDVKSGVNVLENSFSEFMKMLTVDYGVDLDYFETKILDLISVKISIDDIKEKKESKLDVTPQFKSVDDFMIKINEDEAFRDFVYDFFKEGFGEE